VYVWETIEEAEEKPPIEKLGLAQADAGIGMLLAVGIFWFILIGTGATLDIHHKTVQTAQDAAQALVPVAGPIAGFLFAAGLLASAMLAVPVLAATSAYVVGQEFGFRSSLALETVLRHVGGLLAKSGYVWRAHPV
jgi:Mn2+/Fe2+ NRAMP family transporter